MKNFQGVPLVVEGWWSVRALFLKLTYQDKSICIGISIQQHKFATILKAHVFTRSKSKFLSLSMAKTMTVPWVEKSQ